MAPITNIHCDEHREYRIQTFGHGLIFHEGPLDRENVELQDYNGLFIEDLLWAAVNRLQFHNSGEYRCRENSLAITHIEEALHWLNARAQRRENAGVLGTYGKTEGEGK